MAIKKVLITGAAGNLGKYVTQELENDYDLILADIKSKPESLQHNYFQTDITKFNEVKEVCQGVDAVLHLAAIPIDTGEALKIWDINFTGTFNMFEAAAQNKVKKIVFSSSICSYGFEFWSKPFTPEYLPLDENHPLMADDSYGMSKITGEVLGYGYSRRYECSVHCFRLATIIFPGSENCDS